MPEKLTVAITGLGSFIGQRLAHRLLERHPHVRVLGLDLRRPYRLEGRIDFERVDLTEPTVDGRLADVLERHRADVLVHTAFRSEPTADVDADHELETIGSLHVMHACAAAKVRRIVVASTTMVYGPWPDNPNYLTEDHPLRGHPDAHCVVNRVETEALVARWQTRHPDVDVTVLRPCWMMGPTFTDSVVRFFARSRVPVLLGYDPLMQFVHEDDCLHAFERATLEAKRGVYNLVGTGVLPLGTILRVAGKRPWPLPAPLLYRLGSLPNQAQTGDTPAGFFDYLRYLWVADGERGWNAFGEPVYSTREAWMSFVSNRRMRRYR